MRPFVVAVVLGVTGLTVGASLTGPIRSAPAPLPHRLSAPRPPATTAETVVSEVAPAISLVPVVRGLERPIGVVAPPGDDRLFVLEKHGVVLVVDPDGEIGGRPFVDLRADLRSRGFEQGLLSMVFHPDYEENGRVFLSYTNRDGDSRVIEMRVDAGDPDRLDPKSSRSILAVEQHGQFHNAGTLQFGPDGYLWISIGDGKFDDPFGNGQNPGTLLGSILRIDVDAGPPYSVPADNPLLGEGAGEVWAYGMRNPWRFWVDPVSRLIHIGDVGQFTWEEMNVLSIDDGGGSNLGWSVTEGYECYSDPDCDQTGFVPPALVYRHDNGCAVVGGPVYRGRQIPALTGHTLYADFCEGWIRSYTYQDGRVTGEHELWSSLPEGMLSFGTDGDGELYVAGGDGVVYRIVAASTSG